MVTLGEVQGHILKMKGEVADSAAQRIKQHFARNPQDILSDAVMIKITKVMQKQCDGHHIKINNKFCGIKVQNEIFRNAQDENFRRMHGLKLDVEQVYMGLEGVQRTFGASMRPKFFRVKWVCGKTSAGNCRFPEVGFWPLRQNHHFRGGNATLRNHLNTLGGGGNFV